MKWHSKTSSIIGVATVMFVAHGILAVIKKGHFGVEYWFIVVGGMLITGLIFGLLVALLASSLQYLPNLFWWKSKKYKQLKHQ